MHKRIHIETNDDTLWKKIGMEKNQTKSHSIEEDLSKTSLDLQVSQIQRQQEFFSIQTNIYSNEEKKYISNRKEAILYRVSKGQRQKLQNTFVPALVASKTQIFHSENNTPNYLQLIHNLRLQVKSLKEYVNYLEIETLKEIHSLYGFFSQNISQLKTQAELLSEKKLMKLELENKILSQEVQSLKNIVTNWNKEYFSLRNKYDQMEIKMKRSEEEIHKNQHTNFVGFLKNQNIDCTSRKKISSANKTFYGGMHIKREFNSNISKEPIRCKKDGFKNIERVEQKKFANKSFKGRNHSFENYDSERKSQLQEIKALKDKIGELKNTICRNE